MGWFLTDMSLYVSSYNMLTCHVYLVPGFPDQL